MAGSICGQDHENPIILDVQDWPLEELLDTISQISGYNFSYNSMIIPSGSRYSFRSEKKTIDTVLNELFVGTDLTYSIVDDQVIIKPRPIPVPQKQGSNRFNVIGTVRNKITGEFIEDVIVYLDGTSLAGTTNENGYFRIEDIPLGSYKIVFSHISFNTRVYEFNKSVPGDLSVGTELITNNNQLKEVEVLANPLRLSEEKREMLEYFSDQFLGRSSNAIECQILNPEVLAFTRGINETDLRATASEPLIVQNYALGYLLFCELETFEATNNNVKYIGRVRFEELTPTSERQEKKWLKNRKKTYYGSIREFFKSAVEGKHRQRGYRAFFVNTLDDVYSESVREEKLSEFLVETEIPLLYEVNLDKMLYITYSKELESEEYIIDMEKDILQNISFNSNKLLFLNRKPDVQKSLLEVRTSPIYVDPNGNIVNPAGLSVSGYWSWERIADLVPINFDPRKEK